MSLENEYNGWAVALHAVDPGLIPGTLYYAPGQCQELCMLWLHKCKQQSFKYRL